MASPVARSASRESWLVRSPAADRSRERFRPGGAIVERSHRRGEHRARDLMGEVYEYFLGNFARAEGRRGGEFFTPPSVVKVLVEVLEPTKGRVYDPCCGSGGMFVQTERFIHEHDGDPKDIAVFGQESIGETWR